MAETLRAVMADLQWNQKRAEYVNPDATSRSWESTLRSERYCGEKDGEGKMKGRTYTKLRKAGYLLPIQVSISRKEGGGRLLIYFRAGCPPRQQLVVWRSLAHTLKYTQPIIFHHHDT